MASTARSLRYALAILTTSLVTPSVWAHAHLTHQYPAANAQVTAAPQAITLNFSEGVDTGFSGAKITGPKNENIKTLPAKRNEQDQKQLIVPLADSLKFIHFTSLMLVFGFAMYGAWLAPLTIRRLLTKRFLRLQQHAAVWSLISATAMLAVQGGLMGAGWSDVFSPNI